MRLSNQVRRLLSLIMAVAICMSVLPWTVLAADSVTVAEWIYTAEPTGGLPAAATGGANNTGATLELSGATYNKFSSKSISGKGWSVGGYWLLTLDTTGYENLTFSASLRSSKTGPANFKLQYQLSGTDTWTDIEGGTATATDSLKQAFTDVALPAAVSNVAGVKLRVLVADNASVNGGTIAATGTSNINSITITGTAAVVEPAGVVKVDGLTHLDKVYMYLPGEGMALSATAQAKKLTGVVGTVADDKLTVAEGMVELVVSVDANGYYSFVNAEGKHLTSGATGSSLSFANEASDYSLWTLEAAEGGFYVKNVNALYNNTKPQYIEYYKGFTTYSMSTSNTAPYLIQFYKSGVAESVPQYVPTAPAPDPTIDTEPTINTEPTTDPEPAGNTAALVTDVAQLKAGDQIIIAASGSDFALGTTQNKNNRAQAAITKDGTTATYGEDTQIITLEAGTTDGTFAFNVGGYLYAASSSSNYLKTETALSANSSWTIEIDEAGIATVKAQGANKRNWLRHNATSSLFSCYGSGQKDISIYKLPGAEEEPEQPTSVADGNYVIWAPAYNKALSTSYNGFYNNGVAVTLEGDKLTGYTAAEVWTVKNNEDGTITISCAEGKLSMDTSYSSMPLNKVNDTWTLEDAGNGLWYVKNVGRETYIEWYDAKSNWSSYYNIAAGSEGLFALKFTPAEEIGGGEDPVTGVADGDYVIWAPAYNKALSTSYNGFYNNGVAVTLEGDKLTGYTAAEVWTVKNNEDGTITISCADGKLSMDTSYSSMPLNKVNDTWTLEDAGNGLWYVKNVGRETYIEWYEAKSNWSSYYNIAAGSEGLFALKFTPAEEIGGGEDPVTGVADGDYVIWAPAYNKALSTSYNGFYNNGVAVTLEGDKLTGYTAAEVWTVKNNEDGTITISCADGKLSMDTSYSSMPLNKVNDTWTLEDAGNGLWYVKNMGRETYIEWYEAKSNWSSYYNIAAGSEGLFALKFTPAEEIGGEDPTPSTGVADGDYVIWAPAHNKALSSVYGGFYNNGVNVTLNGDVLMGYEKTEVWTVKNNEDGTITVSYGGQNLAMADSFTSMTLGEKNAAWVLESAGDGLWYVKNVAREAYMQWYAENSYWSAYYSIASGAEGKFALRFTPAQVFSEVDSSIVDDIAQWGGMPDPANADKVYGDKFLSGDEKDTAAIYTAVVNGAAVTPYVVGGRTDAPLYYMGGTGVGSGTNDYLQLAVNTAGWGDMELSFRLRSSNSGAGEWTLQYSADNGATFHNFTSGSYEYAYTGWTSEGSYPVSGSGNITNGVAKTSLAAANYVSFKFDVPTGAENCENLLIRLVPGTTRANGKDGAIDKGSSVRFDSVVLSGSPLVDDGITAHVVVTPNGEDEDQGVGTPLTMTCGTEGAVISYRVNGGEWKTYDPANKPVLETLPCGIEVKASAEGKADSVIRRHYYAAGTVQSVKMTPNGGGIYIEGEKSQITLSTATEGATIYVATSEDGLTFTEYAEYTAPIEVAKGFGKLVVKAYAVKDGYNDSAETTRTFTERTSATYSIYFGQLHAHTSISDGTGTITEAFEHAYNVKNLDFLAVTDHSNSFDGEGNGVLAGDGNAISEEWKLAHETAKAFTDDTFVGMYGYEMTWSNGLGHMNTFNTPGWQSRTQADYKTASTALQNYYAALATVPESISQFNHPGTTFGDFTDFSYYSETNDALITLIEVGNGEGAIGSSGYFPSYEYYTRALDKGWHVAPTNNQDNHKGLWGDANTGRSVVLANSLSEEDIYDAMRNYRVYATEDNDLSIYYTLDGNIMGTILASTDVTDTAAISVNISDPTDGNIGKVEVIVNGGLSIASQNVTGASQTVTFSVPTDYNYYYIKITQPDGDIAVTAPVWVGTVEAVGISSLKAESELTIVGEEQTFAMDMFNNEKKDLLIDSIVFTDKATGKVLYTETGITSVPKTGTASCTFGYTFDTDGIITVTATVKGTLDGKEKTYTKDLELTVMPQNITSKVIVDGTHFNDYVSGYYGGRMGNMTTIAANLGIKVTVETNKITPEMLSDCDLLVISAPAKKSGTDNAGEYVMSVFEDEFIKTVADYVKAGGSVIVCGLADYQDKTNDGIHESSVQLNKLLEAMGSTMKINDDEAYDDENNGGQAYRLYPETFNMESQWTKGILTKDDVAEGENYQTYSQYSGCTVDPGDGQWLVKGFDTTYSIDSDHDGKGGVEKGNAVFLAAEDTGFGGTVFAAGGVFISDFEVAAELDNIWDLPYANRTIYENILGVTRTEPEVTPIAEVRKAEKGRIFVVEGYVTSGTDNKNTTFFDAIYIQDETGGLTIFPYSNPGLPLGAKLRITGYTDEYQGDKEIQILTYEILEGDEKVIVPEKMSNKDAMDYEKNGGELVQVEGEVTKILPTSDGKGIAEFTVKDANGDEAKVFIDGYILSGTTGKNELASIVKVGNTVSAVGLLYMHPEGDSTESVAVLRVRNCDEVILVKEGEGTTDPDPTESTGPSEDPTETTAPSESTTPSETTAPSETTKPTDSTTPTQKPGTGGNATTGDNSMILETFAVMMIALAALVVLVLNRKRFTAK